MAVLLEQQGNVEGANLLRNHIDDQIMKCMVDVLTSAVSKLSRKHGYFDLLGFDFMISNANEVVLLEVNTNPALSLDNQCLANLLPGVVDGALQLILDSQGPDRTTDGDLDGFLSHSLPSSYQLIYNEAKGWKYGN